MDLARIMDPNIRFMNNIFYMPVINRKIICFWLPKHQNCEKRKKHTPLQDVIKYSIKKERKTDIKKRKGRGKKKKQNRSDWIGYKTRLRRLFKFSKAAQFHCNCYVYLRIGSILWHFRRLNFKTKKSSSIYKIVMKMQSLEGLMAVRLIA